MGYNLQSAYARVPRTDLKGLEVSLANSTVPSSIPLKPDSNMDNLCRYISFEIKYQILSYVNTRFK